MLAVRFTKAHGAGNDFLLVRATSAPPEGRYPELARAMCDRQRGLGADGLIVFTGPARIRLFNSDGSAAELSGNGTRCAAALLVADENAGPEVAIETGAGRKELRLLRRDGNRFEFEMNAGRPKHSLHQLALRRGKQAVTILDVGNPQCAVLVESLDFDWRELGREIEGHPHFPRRTNVSFVRAVDRHTIEARFYERGAGPTLSSGTGATGAAVAAVLSGKVESPVRVKTEADDLEVEWRGDEALLRGPVEITARGEFYWRD
jgi:diaminopimelate epimerase